jgi:acyl-CoA reductase-like NAD-dependent aldehyde dehydrogenase
MDSISICSNTFICGEKELERAIQAGLSIQRAMAALPSYQKENALRLIGQKPENRAAELANLWACESGNPVSLVLRRVRAHGLRTPRSNPGQ